MLAYVSSLSRTIRAECCLASVYNKFAPNAQICSHHRKPISHCMHATLTLLHPRDDLLGMFFDSS